MWSSYKVSFPFWLGMLRLDVQDPNGYTWTDGNVVNYTNWASGEPTPTKLATMPKNTAIMKIVCDDVKSQACITPKVANDWQQGKWFAYFPIGPINAYVFKKDCFASY